MSVVSGRVLPLAGVLLLCAGCAGGLLETKLPEQQTYVISAGESQAAGGAPAVPVHVAVARPIMAPGLYTERIAVVHADHRLDYFTASRWGVTADLMVQSLLVESLRNTGRLASVQNDLSAFNAQYLLQTELRAFQAEYSSEGAMPLVRVGLVCTLGRLRAREPITEYAVNAEMPAAANTMQAVIAAFEAAYQQAAGALVDRALTELARAEAESAAPPATVPPVATPGS